MRTYTVTEAATYVRRTVKTLQRWDREGTLVANRTGTNRRFYTQDQLDGMLNQSKPEVPRRVIAYARVSSPNQKPDLVNQIKALETFCNASGLSDVTYIKEVGGGMNFKRKHFLQIVDSITKNELSHLVLAHKDRFARFGFELIQDLCDKHGTTVLILNNESLSPEAEMVQDLLTIVHCFSSRLYGLRNYKKALAKVIEIPDDQPITQDSNLSIGGTEDTTS